jgi:glutaredoxin
MIIVYSREDCGSCTRVKTELKSRGIPFIERQIDKDVDSSGIKEQYPTKKALPILVMDNGEVLSGPTEILPRLNEWNNDFGKELLNEGRNG